MSVVLLERPSDHVALVRLNRPEARNALNAEVHAALNAIFAKLSEDADVRCVVLAGSEKVFAAGADLNEMRGKTPEQVPDDRAGVELVRCRRPVIAAVNGFALGGGCEYAMKCDIVIGGSTAKFGQPEVRLGIVPGAGATQLLPRAVGLHNALYMMLTGSLVSAADAHRMGLVSEVVEGNCEPRALELAALIAAMPPLTVAKIKEVACAGTVLPLDDGLRREAEAHLAMFATRDLQEGVAAFLEKRRPRFEGR
jgi:enoyl-CoA hydratase/carnithine racemase